MDGMDIMTARNLLPITKGTFTSFSLTHWTFTFHSSWVGGVDPIDMSLTSISQPMVN